MNLGVRMGAAIAVCAACLLVAGRASTADYPLFLWSISDDDLVAPIGAVIDVAVDGQRTVYLLDSQVKEVRRIAVDGSELPPLGREGEGPGELMHPRLVGAIPAGGCLVLQDFHAPAVCLGRDGELCTAPRLDALREGFALVAFAGTARLTAAGDLIVPATTTERPYSAASPAADLGTALSVFRLRRGDPSPTILFTDSPHLGDARTVRFRRDAGFYALRCWDVNAEGRLVFADPNGRYEVRIGHPADGPTQTVELPPAPGDAEKLAKRARKHRRSVEKLERIADVQWAGDACVLVKPIAAATGERLWQSGVIELFDLAGTSLGRREIADDYDPDRDALFIRGGVMVIVRGGMSAVMSSLHLPTKAGAVREENAIVVEAWDLSP